MEFLKQHVEALIFVSPQAAAVADIQSVLNEVFQAEVPESDILAAIEQIRDQFQQEEYAFETY